MREAIVSVRDEGAPLGHEAEMSLLREGGLVDIEVLSCDGPRVAVRAQVERELDEERLRGLTTVSWFDRVAGSGPGASYLVEFDMSEKAETPDGCMGDLVGCGTVDVSEEGFTLGMAGRQEAISETIAAYEEAGADVRLETLHDYEGGNDPIDRLTPRQREVLETAYDLGYFEVPRTATTGDVANALGVDDSTVAEHLQRAERNLVSGVLEGPA